MKRLVWVNVLLFVLSVVALGLAQDREGFPAWWDEITDAQKAWAKTAQLGPYAPQGIDWSEIEALAKQEGRVVVYSQSSRVKKAAAYFMEKYPDIKVEYFDLYIYDLIARWQKELTAGVHNVDVIFADDEAMMINEFLVPPNKMIWNFITPTVKENWVDSKYYDPLLVIRVSFQAIFYNPGTYSTPPIDDLWDLTKPEWSRKVLIMDPTVDPFALNFLTTIVQHADELAAAYEEEFGKPIKLDKGVPNAGYQWLKALIENRPVVVASDDEVAEGVGAEGSDKIGLAAFYSKYRWTLQGRVNIYPLHDVRPFAGTQTFTYLGISDQAPHPNAAKLFIREMIGTQDDPIGAFYPWHVPGDFKPRVGLSAPEGMPGGGTFDVLSPHYAPNDPKFLYDEALKVRDFWLAYYQG